VAGRFDSAAGGCAASKSPARTAAPEDSLPELDIALNDRPQLDAPRIPLVPFF
jgi:hypothetical protein